MCDLKYLKLSAWLIPIWLVGCSSLESYLPTGRVDYRASTPTAGLEVPPDIRNLPLEDPLAVPVTTANLSDQQRSVSRANFGSAVLQTPENLQIQRLGDRQWLIANQSAEVLWPQLKAFWTEKGFALQRDEPQLGILETEWKENRADIPQDAVRRLLGNVLDLVYSAATRDKYRLRLERISENRTEIYLTHYGIEEVLTGDTGRRSPDADGPIMWQNRPRDPELEIEMLRRLMVHLGVTEQTASAQLVSTNDAATTTRTRRSTMAGTEGLLIEKDYNQAWRSVGLALDGSSFVVQDQNRGDGRYTVEFFPEGSPRNNANSGGFWSNMAFWRSRQPTRGTLYWVRLADLQGQTFVVVQTPEGQPETSRISDQLLDTIAKNLP